MIELLSPNDLCFSIISIKLNDSSQFSSLPPSLKSLNPGGQFPIMNFFSMKQYQKDFKNGVDYLVSLNKHSFTFEFRKDCLNQIKSNNSYLQTAPDYITLIVLHSYISWFMNYIKRHTTTDIDTLLNLLIFLLPIKNNKVVTKVRCFAASAFMHICSDIVESTYLENVTVLFTPLVEFLTMNDDLPQSAFDLLLKTGNRVIDKNSLTFTKETSQLVNFIVIIIRSCHERCPQYITSAIVFLMRNSLIGLDNNALSFFGRSLLTLGIESAFDIVSDFPDAILKLILDNEPIFPCNISSLNDGVTFPPNNFAIVYDLINFQTFESDIIISNPPCFPELLSPSEIVRPELLTKFELIYKIAENEKELTVIILKKVASILSALKLSPHYYDVYAAFLYFMYILSHNSPFPKFPVEIFLSQLFDQNNTVFSPNKDYQKVNCIRHLAYVNLLNQSSSVISTVFSTIKIKPLSFAELVYRFLPCINNMKYLYNIFSPLIEGIAAAIIFYQRFQTVSDELRTSANDARLVSFTFIDIILKIYDFRKICFEESTYFVDAMISFVFEKPTRKWALGCISDALKQLSISAEYLVSKCIGLYKQTFKFKYSEFEIQQSESLIHFLNDDLFSSDAKLAKGFEPVISYICKWITGLPKKKFSYGILNETLDVFTRFSQHLMTQSDISAIESTIRSLYGSEPSNELLAKLLSTIASEKLKIFKENNDYIIPIEPRFIIKQPKGMRLLISLYEFSSKFSQILEFITDLCRFDLNNCEQCQKGEFDLYLVGRLFSWRNDQVLKKKDVEASLLILKLISARSCTVSFVHQMISLLCPIDGKSLPRFYRSILDSLQNLIQKSKKVPATPLPILSITRVNISQVQLMKSFTISFWYFMHPNEEKVIICHIANNNYKLIIEIENQKMAILFQHNSEQWNGDVNYDLPTNKWSMATFSIDVQSSQSIVQPTIDGNEVPIIVFPTFDLSTKPSDLIVGLTKSDRIAIFLGSFGISKSLFDLSDTITLFDIGPRKIPPRLIMYFTARDRNDYFSVDIFPANINFTFNKVRTLHKPSFTDVLIDVCGISTLLPILTHIDLVYKNKNRFPFLLETFIGILEMSLTLSANAQKLFSSEKSFLIISNLLMMSKNVNLTYKVFIQFCSLFELLNDEKCRNQLLFGILLKIDLWLKADADSFKKIIRYWSTSLVPLNIMHVMQKVRFCDIISMLRIFLWYDPIEKTTIMFASNKKRCKDEMIDVKNCRDFLFSIALNMARLGLENDEFHFLVSQILTVSEDQQVIDLLNFVMELLNEEKAVRSKCATVMEPLVYLLFMYSSDIEILELTFKIIIKAHQLSLIKGLTLSQHFDSIMHKLPGSYASEPILRKLMEICNSTTPQLFSLCAMIAFSLGQDSFNVLLDTLKPNTKFCSNPFWSLWLVIGLYKIEDETFHNRVIDFLIKISPQQWKNIYWIIDIIGRALQLKHEQLKRRFIMEIGTRILEQELEELDLQKIKHFLIILPLFLFLRQKKQFDRRLFNSKNLTPKPPQPLPTKRIRRVITQSSGLSTPSIPLLSFRRRSSSFSSENLPLASSQSNFDTLDFIPFKLSELTAMVQVLIGDSEGLFFGLRITVDNLWEDIEIARLANKVFMKYPDEMFNDSILFINAFLLHYDPHVAMSSVDQMLLDDSQSPSGQLSLFNKHASKLGLRKATESPPSEYILRCFAFLKRFEDDNHDEKMLSEMHDFLIVNRDRSDDLFFVLETDLGQISSEFITDFKESLSLNNTKYSKFWNHFWRSVTVDRAPWSSALSLQQRRNIHYRRDFTSCSNFCPFKLRQNNDFDDHIHASFARDTGSSATASELTEKYRKNLSEKYKNTSNEPLNLIEAGDSQDESIDSSLPIISKCIFESQCQIITLTNNAAEPTSLFSLQKECVVITKKDQSTKYIKIENIVSVLARTHLQRETAIEIFMDDGASFFINFPLVNSRTVIQQFKILNKPAHPFLLQTQTPKQFALFLKCKNKWIKREISNFEYLMLLNFISGRSFGNAHQYPVMPWILTDYDSPRLKISDPTIYRDLSKPIGSFGSERLSNLEDIFNESNYYYSSGYINPIFLYHYLVRMEPFTSLHIGIQGGQFDHPARMFFSIKKTFESVTTQGNDYRELIPEFFFQPEFLENSNNFDFGQINGIALNDVELPKWAKSPLEFVYLHRKALESEHVSLHLNEWIDLIWGDKQRGQKAVEAKNVFKSEMYSDVWSYFERSQNFNRPEIEAILSYVGQIPPQLFDKPHPLRVTRGSEAKQINQLFSYKTDFPSKIAISAIQKIDDRALLFLTIDKAGTCQETFMDYFHLRSDSPSIRFTMAAVPVPSPQLSSTSSPKSSSLKHRKSLSDLVSEDNKVNNGFCTIGHKKTLQGQIDFLQNKKLIWCYLSSQKKFLVVGNKQKSDIFTVDYQTGQMKCVIKSRNEIISITTDEKWLVVANKDSKVSLYLTKDFKEVFSVPSFRDWIRCCHLSNTFHSLICGTRDNSMMIVSMTSQSLVRIIDLHAKPILCCITPSWGFCVVYMRNVSDGKFLHSIAVYNANGKIIKSSEIFAAINRMISFKDKKGFDFVLMADENNRIFCFEAFFCDVGKEIFKALSSITALYYLYKEQTAVVLCEDGQIYFLPINTE